MPTFTYQAKKGPAERVSGSLEAKSLPQAISSLEQGGLFLISIEEDKKSAPGSGISALRRIRRQELTVFTRQFANLIESGVTVIDALSILSQQATNSSLKNMLIDISDQIKNGLTLSKAISAYPRHFSQFYCAVVNAGEISGALEIVLNRLADFCEQEEKIRADIASALAYPAMIVAVGSFTIHILLTYAVPKLTSMFEEAGESLPLATRILIAVSEALKSYWWLALIALALAFFLFRQAKNQKEKLILDRFLLGTPLIGKIILKSEMMHFVRTLSLLLESGVTILIALDAVSDTITNSVIKSEVKKLDSDIKEGLSLSSAIRKSHYFPPYVVNIISVGEEAGTIEKSLRRVGVSYEQELNRLIRTLTSLLEPVMILIMGLIVAFIVVAMLLPIFQINLMTR